MRWRDGEEKAVRKTIAVDFDGCLCKGKWPDIGEAHEQVIRELIRQQADGAKIILWTCREGDQLDHAVMWCLNHGLKFDAINDNLKENTEYFGNNSRKVFADEYWDDKSVVVTKVGDDIVMAGRRIDGGVAVKKWQTRYVSMETEREAAETGDGAKRGFRDSCADQGYQYHPPRKGLREKLREIWAIVRE